jgi:UDP-glucuronate 4-epimerase
LKGIILAGGSGKPRKEFLWSEDMADACVFIMENRDFSDVIASKTKQSINLQPNESSAPYRIYNIGNNAPLSFMTFIETIENALGKKAEKHFLPMQDGDVVSTYADVSGLINDFEYKSDTNSLMGFMSL